MTEIARVSSATLAPLGPDLCPEVYAWVSELRTLFTATDLSISRFARLHPHIDKGTVSRYLSGRRVPRDRWFLDTLLNVQADLGKAPTPDVREHLAGLQLTALETVHPHEYKIRIFSDKLELAVTGQREAERYARDIEEQLAERVRQIHDLTADIRRLRGAWDDDRAAMRAEHDRLAEEIADLTEQLRWARDRAVKTERRCQELEDLIDRLETHRSAETDRLATSAVSQGSRAATRRYESARSMAGLLDGLRRAGAEAQFAELAQRAATDAPVDRLEEVDRLLESLSKAGAETQFAELAERAATQGSLEHGACVALLLNSLRRARADSQVEKLLARDPATHASLEHLPGVTFLLDTLRGMGADAQAAKLAGRAVAEAPLNDPAGVIELLEFLRDAGAADQIAVLTARVASNTSTGGAIDSGTLLDIMQRERPSARPAG